jgi:hypothetical protein
MSLPVREFRAREFRSLKAITYPVSNLDVFVGGNGVGKTNLYAPATRPGSAIPAGIASGSLRISQQVAQHVSSVTMERMAALRRRY